MWRFILHRLEVVIPTLVGVTLLAFALIHAIPGDPVQIMVGEHGITPAHHAELMHQLGLDLPLYQQYGHYLVGIAHGDLGRSLVNHEPVLSEFMARFPATLELSIFATLLAVAIGLPLGVIAAVKRDTFLDHGVIAIAQAGYSMPIFWWGLLLILLFSVQLGWTPVSGRLDDARFWIDTPTGFMLIDTLRSGVPGAFADAVKHLVLPAIVLGTIPMAVIARMTRSAMLEVLGEDFIRTTRARGVSRWRLILVHALRNALIPVVTVIGLQVGGLLAGAILTETIFSWPGIGKWLVDAISRRDYPVVQGGILLIATMIIFVNLSVDVVYGWIDPRIRYPR